MNILTSVILMLMVFALVTSARLENFVSSHRRYITLSRHVEQKERALSAAEAKKLYKDCRVRVEKKGQRGDKTGEKLNRFFNISPFLTPDHPQSGSVGELLSHLIAELYADQPVFLEAKETSPDVFDRLLDRLQAVAQQEENRGRIKQLNDLAGLDLQDPLLQLLLYKILHGAQNLEGRGYPPLSRYVRIFKTEKKISLYLAERELLLALMPSDRVLEVEQLRQEIYLKLSNNEGDSEELQRFFAARVERAIPASWQDLVTYAVSKTHPPSNKP